MHKRSQGVLQNISLRAHSDCQGNVVICDFIGENCVLVSIIGTILYLLGLQVYLVCVLGGKGVGTAYAVPKQIFY